MITPISPIDLSGSLGSLSSSGQAGKTENSFADIFKNLVEQVNQTDNTVKDDQILTATGQSDDLHTAMINLSKADLALELLVQVRNKTLDAYNEVMKLNL